ncbi:MAG: GTPase HflX [Candidatus Marinimicrobia bacterium]|nr:GTPase HflX [Candidatus Neomarinimicrobiota bacterium]
MHTVPRDGQPKELALLVGVGPRDDRSNMVQEHLTELAELTLTAGGEVAGQIIQRRDRPDPATFIGKGKADQMIHQAQELGCSLIVFDDDLGPTQQKNLQKMAGDELKVIDRSGLILDIFARHARTRESKTQVELARLQYLLPRLTRQWTHLERQMGGIGARGGPGETQIEVDRRLIRKRILRLESDLVRISAERSTQRQSRKFLFRVVLVGYTNAGKSTLFNALTGATTLVEDQLFATLDTTTRKLSLNAGKPILISDTVGFIRKLPHHLVASFRATLAEVAEAHLVIRVLDASSPQIKEHDETTESVLQDLGAQSSPTITVLNKIDLVEDQQAMAHLKRAFPDAVMVSAAKRLRLEQVDEAIKAAKSAQYRQAILTVASGNSELIGAVYDNLEVSSRSFEGDKTVLEVSGPSELVEVFMEKAAASSSGR